MSSRKDVEFRGDFGPLWTRSIKTPTDKENNQFAENIEGEIIHSTNMPELKDTNQAIDKTSKRCLS
tara:strand:+ start:353 stop:550 length:198 start_codon:yes stop_codon:yes gene_type:complete